MEMAGPPAPGSPMCCSVAQFPCESVRIVITVDEPGNPSGVDGSAKSSVPVTERVTKSGP